MCYWGKGKYIGTEFPDEIGKKVMIGSDDINEVYKIKFIESEFEVDNIFLEEILFEDE